MFFKFQKQEAYLMVTKCMQKKLTQMNKIDIDQLILKD